MAGQRDNCLVEQSRDAFDVRMFCVCEPSIFFSSFILTWSQCFDFPVPLPWRTFKVSSVLLVFRQVKPLLAQVRGQCSANG